MVTPACDPCGSLASSRHSGCITVNILKACREIYRILMTLPEKSHGTTSAMLIGGDNLKGRLGFKEEGHPLQHAKVMM